MIVVSVEFKIGITNYSFECVEFIVFPWTCVSSTIRLGYMNGNLRSPCAALLSHWLTPHKHGILISLIIQILTLLNMVSPPARTSYTCHASASCVSEVQVEMWQ